MSSPATLCASAGAMTPSFMETIGTIVKAGNFADRTYVFYWNEETETEPASELEIREISFYLDAGKVSHEFRLRFDPHNADEGNIQFFVAVSELFYPEPNRNGERLSEHILEAASSRSSLGIPLASLGSGVDVEGLFKMPILEVMELAAQHVVGFEGLAAIFLAPPS